MDNFYIHLTELGFMTEGPYNKQGTDGKGFYDSYTVVKKQLRKDMEAIRKKNDSLNLKELKHIFSPFFQVKAALGAIEDEEERTEEQIEDNFKKAYVKFLEESLNNSSSDLSQYIGITDNIEKLTTAVSNVPPNINSLLSFTRAADLSLPDFETLEKILSNAAKTSEDLLNGYLKKIAAGSNQYISYKAVSDKIKKALEKEQKEGWLAKVLFEDSKTNIQVSSDGEEKELDMKDTMLLVRRKIAQAVNQVVGNNDVTQKNILAFLKKGTEGNVGGVLGEQFLKFLINQGNSIVGNTVKNVEEAIVTGQELSAIAVETKGQKFKGVVKGVGNIPQNIPKKVKDALTNMRNSWTVQVYPSKNDDKTTVMTTQIKPDIRFKEYNMSVKNYNLTSQNPTLEQTTIAKVLSYRNKVSQYIFMNASSEKRNGKMQGQDISYQGYPKIRAQIIDVLGCWVIASALGGLRAGRPTANIFIAIDNSKNKLYVIDIRDTIERMLREIEQEAFQLDTFLESVEGSGKQFILGLRNGEKGVLIENPYEKKMDAETRSQEVENKIWQKYMDVHIAIQLPKKYFM